MADSSTRAPERCVEEDGRRRGRKRRWQGCDTSPRWQVLASAHGAVLRSVPKEPAPAAGLPLGSRPRGTDPTSAGLNATKRLCGECREPPGPGTGTKPEHGCLQTRSRAGGSRDAVQTPRPRSGATQEMCPAPGGPGLPRSPSRVQRGFNPLAQPCRGWDPAAIPLVAPRPGWGQPCLLPSPISSGELFMQQFGEPKFPQNHPRLQGQGLLGELACFHLHQKHPQGTAAAPAGLAKRRNWRRAGTRGALLPT